jgi:hypothetical protein
MIERRDGLPADLTILGKLLCARARARAVPPNGTRCHLS